MSAPSYPDRFDRLPSVKDKGFVVDYVGVVHHLKKVLDSKLPSLVKNREHIISRVMEIAETNHDTILYAP
jgi:hypothetical protein